MMKKAFTYFMYSVPIGILATSVCDRALMGLAVDELDEEDKVRSELEKIRQRESSRNAAELAAVVDSVKKSAATPPR
jgi:hypothetical protein